MRAFELVTMEETPRVVLHEGPAVYENLQVWGTNGIFIRIWFALAPAVDWAQVTVAFDTFDLAFNFAEQIAVDQRWGKRPATLFEWQIPSLFSPIKQAVRENKPLALIMIATAQLDE